jgi:hypothetical protein
MGCGFSCLGRRLQRCRRVADALADELAGVAPRRAAPPAGGGGGGGGGDGDGDGDKPSVTPAGGRGGGRRHAPCARGRGAPAERARRALAPAAQATRCCAAAGVIDYRCMLQSAELCAFP